MVVLRVGSRVHVVVGSVLGFRVVVLRDGLSCVRKICEMNIFVVNNSVCVISFRVAV